MVGSVTFIIGIGLIIYSYTATRSGKIRSRGRIWYKRDNPVGYRVVLLFNFLLGVFMVVVGILAYLKMIDINKNIW